MAERIAVHVRNLAQNDVLVLGIVFLGIASTARYLVPGGPSDAWPASPLTLALGHVLMIGCLVLLRANPRDPGMLRTVGFVHTMIALGVAITRSSELVTATGDGSREIAVVLSALGPAISPHVLAVCFAVACERLHAPPSPEPIEKTWKESLRRVKTTEKNMRESLESLGGAIASLDGATRRVADNLGGVRRASDGFRSEIAGAAESAKSLRELFGLTTDLRKLIEGLIALVNSELFINGRDDEAEEPHDGRERDREAEHRDPGAGEIELDEYDA